jgi:hypothetical protein
MKVLTSMSLTILMTLGSYAHAESVELGSWMEASANDSNDCIQARKEYEDAEDYLDNVSRPSSFELKMLSDAEESVALHCNVASNP